MNESGIFHIGLLKNTVKFTDEEIANFKSENHFMKVAVDLLIEIGEIACYLYSTHPLDENLAPRKWNRNEAIVMGLMVRIVKLQVEVLDANQKDKLESVQIMARCLCETVINILYLLQNRGNNQFFDQYVAHSLRSEKELLERILFNIKKRKGAEVPIEKRMKRSILKSFDVAGIKPEEVDLKVRSEWTKISLYKRAKFVGLGEQYLAAFALLCHEVHGNWQDLLRHHLEYKDGEFKPYMKSLHSRPQIIIAVALFSAYACWEYSKSFLPECLKREQMRECVEALIEKCQKLDRAHERYVQEHGNIGT